MNVVIAVVVIRMAAGMTMVIESMEGIMNSMARTVVMAQMALGLATFRKPAET